ncbi:WD40 repeat domain-containing serine/threonine protein kinase [Streptomyces anulatus]|uniref:WD40 repeat domain-containing serine/threonine protein kinase n=1 Tax=Streptomyces TaxID=1883 RepID=UPI000939EB6A|nr:serine/threonine-protein kinase [Streptomyces sp. TSRI0261]
MDRDLLAPDDPQRIGSCWLASRLGAGGQGVVYEAYTSTGERCAVKVLRAESAADEFAKDRFRKEVTAAQRVDSFCTARVLAADLEADPPYIASEFIDGRDLHTVVRTRGPFTGDELVRLATGIATALTAIHAASVVHRDLKPGNVLLGPDGPRVIDFGIARTQEMSLTATGKMMGTPGYMAPEVLRGSRADVKSDVFAWGAVVLFAATGRAPFHGENLGEIVVRVTELQPDLTPLPERLRSLVGAALAKDPSLRPGSDELLLRLLTGGERLPPASSAAELLNRGSRASTLPEIAGHASATLPDWGAVAERAFVALDPAAQAAAQDLLLRLVAPGEAPDGSQDGVRSAGPEELFGGRPAHEAAAARQALAIFTPERILIADPDGVIRPAGAALLKAWPRLGSWAAEHRAALRVRRRTGDAAREWQQAGRKPDGLLHGHALRAALDQAATAPAALRPNALERAFLDAARKEEFRRTRQRRRLQGGIVVLLVLALTAGTVAWNLRRTNAEQQALATARTVASVAEGIRTSDPETAALLSLAAWQVAPATEARSALYRSALQRETAVFRDPTTPPAGIETYMSRSLSAGGRYLTTEVHEATGPRTYHYDIRTGKPVDLGDAGTTPGPVSPDGRFVVSGDVVWNLGTNEPVGKVPEAAGTVLALSAGGGRALTLTQDEGSNVVDTRTGRTLARLSSTGPVLVDDGRYLVSCPAGGHPLLYDLGSGKRTRMREADPETRCDETSQVWSSADGTKLLTSADGHLYVWDTRTRKLVSDISVDGAPEDVAAAISPDGRLVARIEGGALVVSAAEHLEQPLLTHEAAARDQELLGEHTGQALAIDSAARELVYLDSASVHVLDLAVTGLPRQAEQEEVGSYGPWAASLHTVSSTLEASRLRSWSVTQATGANGAAADRTSDVAVATKSVLGSHLGEGDLPVAFSRAGTLAAYPSQEPAEGESFNVLLQDVRTGKVRHSVELGAPERGRAVTLAFSADEHTLAVSRLVDVDQDARSVDIVDVRTGRKTRTLKGVGGYRIALGGSGTDLVLVTSSGDRANLSDNTTARSALGTAEVYAVAFSPDGTMLAVAEPNGITLWNADGTRRVGRLPGPAASQLRFSPNGDQLVAVVAGERIHIWDVRSQRPLGGILPGIEDRLLDVAFDDRGNLHLAGEQVRSHKVSLDSDRLTRTICERVHRARNLTRAEWEQNVPDAPYRQVCP